MKGSATATVEVLTAEVKALMVGSRQVTLSVYRQLDEVEPDDIEPFGRVRDGRDGSGIYVIGRDPAGSLVRSHRQAIPPKLAWADLGDLTKRGAEARWETVNANIEGRDFIVQLGEQDFGLAGNVWAWLGDDAYLEGAERARQAALSHDRWTAEWGEWESLPLIVLAGLR